VLKTIKEKLWRTRHLVKLAREDLGILKERVARIEESVCAADGPLAWSPSTFRTWQRVWSCLQISSLGPEGKERVGCEVDGGYVVPKDWRNLSRLFSLGIGPDNSFDIAFAEAGIPVEAYDPTILRLPQEHAKIRWIKSMVVPKPRLSKNEISLGQILEKISEEAAPGLKMDIEGSEYGVILSCPEERLRHLRFFVAEFHGIANTIASEQTAALEACWNRLSGIFDTVHLHANNAGGARILGGALVPNILEVTMVNRKFYPTVSSLEFFPGPMDRPNLRERAEIQICPPWPQPC
jgi:hypothetical protein